MPQEPNKSQGSANQGDNNSGENQSSTNIEQEIKTEKIADAKDSEKNNADEEIQKLKADLEFMTNAAKRALADLQNYKKRVQEENKSLQNFANLVLIMEILPILDNFNRALNQAQEEEKKSNLFLGISNIKKQFDDLLKKQGLIEIKALGEKFDPLKHEALLKGPGEIDTVLEVLEVGYMLGDKILKPSKVKVGDGTM